VAIEGNMENDKVDFKTIMTNDSKSDRRLVGYAVRNTIEDKELAWARLATLFNTHINVYT
jgi:hypothetical protein